MNGNMSVLCNSPCHLFDAVVSCDSREMALHVMCHSGLVAFECLANGALHCGGGESDGL